MTEHLQSPHSYEAYGVRIASNAALPGLPAAGRVCSLRVTLELSPPSSIQTRTGEWFECWQDDGAAYLVWDDLFQFRIDSTGESIVATPAHQANIEALAVYLLGQVLAVALSRQGYEVLHGSAVARGGRALVILGGSGYGKSTLTAALWQQGWQVVSDDLIHPIESHKRLQIPAGPARIKLRADSAALFMSDLPRALALMNPLTDKFVFPLPDIARAPIDIAGIICLSAHQHPDQANAHHPQPLWRLLRGMETFTALAENTFNVLDWQPDRDQRLLRQLSRIVSEAPVFELQRQRELPSVVTQAEQITAWWDLNHPDSTTPCPEWIAPVRTHPAARMDP